MITRAVDPFVLEDFHHPTFNFYLSRMYSRNAFNCGCDFYAYNFKRSYISVSKILVIAHIHDVCSCFYGILYNVLDACVPRKNMFIGFFFVEIPMRNRKLHALCKKEK